MVNIQGANNQVNYYKPLTTNPALTPAYYNSPPVNANQQGAQGQSETQMVSPSKLNTDAVYRTWINPKALNNPAGEAKLTLIHVNDNHRKVGGLTQFKTAFDQIESKLKGSDYGLIKVHSGDYNVGTDEKKLQIQVELLNKLGINYATTGNHEFDIGTDDLKKFAKQMKNANFLTVVANLKLPPGCALDELKQSGKIVDSAIHTINGQQYGVVGMAPIDLKKTVDAKVKWTGIDVLPEAESIQKLQEEVNKLKAKGINKIILVAHAGSEMEKKVAQSTEGIDIILGGHTHDLLKPLEPGVTIVESASKEPVLLFQNGQNGTHFGVTDAVFDQNGIIKNAISRQEKADNFEVNHETAAIEDKILGPSPLLAEAKNNAVVDDVKLRENPIANFVCDAVLDHTKADLALIRSANIRDNVKAGKLTERAIDEILPFVDPVTVSKISGKNIVDALNHGAQSPLRKDKRPGIMQVSGMKYTIDENCKATNVMVQNKDGSYSPIDFNKEYEVASDQFTVKGGDGYGMLSDPLSVVRYYYDDYADAVKKHLKGRSDKSINFHTDGRINIVPSQANPAPKKVEKVVAVANNTPVTAPQVYVTDPLPKTMTPVLQPRVAMTMPVYQMMPPQYYYQQPPIQPVMPAPMPYPIGVMPMPGQY